MSSNRKKEKLFGFPLTRSSALLLFISFGFVLFTCFYLIYQIITIYNSTSQVPVVMLLGVTLLLIISVYIVYKVLSFNKKNNR